MWQCDCRLASLSLGRASPLRSAGVEGVVSSTAAHRRRGCLERSGCCLAMRLLCVAMRLLLKGSVQVRCDVTAAQRQCPEDSDCGCLVRPKPFFFL